MPQKISLGGCSSPLNAFNSAQQHDEKAHNKQRETPVESTEQMALLPYRAELQPQQCLTELQVVQMLRL